MTITEEMAAIKAACTHAWAPWLGKAACCSRCGLLCSHMPSSGQRTRGRGIARALRETKAAVARMGER